MGQEARGEHLLVVALDGIAADDLEDPGVVDLEDDIELDVEHSDDDADSKADGDVAVAVVTKDMIAQCGAGEEDMDDIAGLAARAESAKISITVREKDKRLCRISVRTSDGVNASRICEVFGGGGHAAAAGCTIEAEPERAVRMLMEVIDEVCK